MHIWNLLSSIQSMVLQIMGSKYHVHLKYFEITDGVVFGIRKIVSLVFKYVFDFAMGPLHFKLFQFKVVMVLFGSPICIGCAYGV